VVAVQTVLERPSQTINWRSWLDTGALTHADSHALYQCLARRVQSQRGRCNRQSVPQ
jgi:hypothetical protein